MERDGLGLRCGLIKCGTSFLRLYLESTPLRGLFAPLAELRTKGNPNAEGGE